MEEQNTTTTNLEIIIQEDETLYLDGVNTTLILKTYKI